MGIHVFRSTFVTVFCVGMLAPPLLASEPNSQTQKREAELDVALDANGVLTGEIRNQQGRPQANADIVLWQTGELLQRRRTDHLGRFQFPGLRGGLYRVATSNATVACRAWTSRAAPPKSRTSLLIVANQVSARGQTPINEVFCANPFLMGTVIAAAIAIPIAIHNSGDDELPDGS